VAAIFFSFLHFRPCSSIAPFVPQTSPMAHQRRRRTRLRTTPTTDVSNTFICTGTAQATESPSRPNIPIRSLNVRAPLLHPPRLSISQVNATLLSTIQDTTDVHEENDSVAFDAAGNHGNDTNVDMLANAIIPMADPYNILLIWRNPAALLAVFLTRGSGNYTRSQYERFNRLLIPYIRAKVLAPLPHYSTLSRSYFPFVRDHCLPSVRDVLLTIVHRITSESEDFKVQVVDPGTWAVYDVANPEFFELVYNSAYSAHPSSIDHVPIVTDRRILNSELLSFSDCSLDGSFPFFAYPGDTISVSVDDAQNLDPPPSSSASEGVVGTVHSISYNNPADPAIAATLAPFLKAADKCVRLMASDPFSSSVWVLVYRFWTTPEDSRGRILLELRNFPESPLFVQHGVYDVASPTGFPYLGPITGRRRRADSI